MTVIQFPSKPPAPRLVYQPVSGRGFLMSLLGGLGKAVAAVVALAVAVVLVLSIVLGGR